MLRKVDTLGRIVLPAEMREQLHITGKDALDITVQGNTLVLVKEGESCIFCKQTENLVKLNNFSVCEICRQRLAAAKNGDVLSPL